MGFRKFQSLIFVALFAFSTTVHGIEATKALRLLFGCASRIVTQAFVRPPVSQLPQDWTVKGSIPHYKGIAATGDANYQFRQVLTSLDIIPDVETEVKLDHVNFLIGKRVVSLGEGASSFVINLLQGNIATATAIDLWYDQNIPSGPDFYHLRKFKEETKRFPGAFIAADAKATPLPSESADFVFSSNLVNHLSVADQKRLILESLRLLPIGGEMRHYGFRTAHIEELERYLNQVFPQYLQIKKTKKVVDIRDAYEGKTTAAGWVLTVIKIKEIKFDDPAIKVFAPEEEVFVPLEIKRAPRPNPIYSNGGIFVRF